MHGEHYSNYVNSNEGSREGKKGDPQIKTLDIAYSESGTQNHDQLTYTKDLLQLESYQPIISRNIPDNCKIITTPLVAGNWATALQGHPDQEFTQFILRGIRQGFCIGFDYRNHRTKSAVSNMVSAVRNPEPYIKTEVEANKNHAGTRVPFL